MADKEQGKHPIMTKPLPDILDALQEAIQAAWQATLSANEAAKEARMAGEAAALEAGKVASQMIGEVEDKLSTDILAARKIAEEALRLANLLDKAIPAGKNADIKAYNEALKAK